MPEYRILQKGDFDHYKVQVKHKTKWEDVLDTDTDRRPEPRIFSHVDYAMGYIRQCRQETLLDVLDWHVLT